MAVTLAEIKELRARTGVGINHVKEALEHSGGDLEKAIVYLREKGIAKAAKRAGNATNNGLIGHYMHGKTIGVMVELQSETDFASGSEKFQELARELAMHIAAQSPDYISKEEVPADVLETEKKVYAKDVEGKPEQIAEKILEGKLSKFYEEVVLLEQPYVRDDSKKIKDLLNEYIAALGESIKIKRFVKMQLGLDPIMATAQE
jgi:elongation factor Ts